jgi:hypothetical protein
MAQRANLIATYNSNPTLQSRYTLQQYLDMFGFGQTPTTPTPTPDPDPTPTPTPEVPGIPNIINQNLGGGDGGDGGPQGIATPTQYYDKTYVGSNPNYTGPTKFPLTGAPIMGGFEKTEGPGFFDQVGNAISGLAGLYQKYSPVGMIGKAIQDRKDFKQAQTNKALEQIAMQQKIREAEAQAAALANATTYRYNDPSQKAPPGPDNRSDAFRGGGANVPSSSYTSTGREGFGYGLADGGRVYLYNRLK